MERPLVYWLGRPRVPKVPLTCLGCMAAAVQPNSLWNFQKTFNFMKLFPLKFTEFAFKLLRVLARRSDRGGAR